MDNEESQGYSTDAMLPLKEIPFLGMMYKMKLMFRIGYNLTLLTPGIVKKIIID